ncbi:MAG: hypothetical protein ACRDSR_03460 [Pseudonocardiaceae bacterium]
MIREDRELLADLARLNTAMVPFAMRIIEDTATAAEQHKYALWLIAAGERLQRRADGVRGAVVDGEVLIAGPLTFPPQTVEPCAES